MRFVLGILSCIAVALVAGCGMHKSQPQTATVYVPPAPAPSVPAAPVTNNEVPAMTVEPTIDAPPNSPTMSVSKVVWDNFQAYLARVGRVGDGYYAISADGTSGGSWACGETMCMGGFDGQAAALQQCATASAGKTCVIFAKDNHILMKYQVAQ
jgi:hypothetical protein